MSSLLVIVLLSYLVGSFPSAIVWGRLTRRIDIRDYGSKNPGGTNAFRVLGWRAGVGVSLIDVGKGVLAAALISRIRMDAVPITHEMVQVLAGSFAVVGHIWTVLAKFKGGKGVATAGGMMIAIFPWAALICALVFVAVFWRTRYVSLGSMAAASAFPAALLLLSRFFDKPISNPLLGLSFLISGLIVFTHRDNIRRLLKGTESRFSKESLRTKR